MNDKMKGYVPLVAKSTRILSHTIIKQLPFKFKGGQMFSLYARPKDPNNQEIDILVEARLIQDEEDNTQPFPLVLYSWSPAAFVEITSAPLGEYDLYVGAHNELDCNDDAEPSREYYKNK